MWVQGQITTIVKEKKGLWTRWPIHASREPARWPSIKQTVMKYDDDHHHYTNRCNSRRGALCAEAEHRSTHHRRISKHPPPSHKRARSTRYAVSPSPYRNPNETCRSYAPIRTGHRISPPRTLPPSLTPRRAKTRLKRANAKHYSACSPIAHSFLRTQRD